MFLLIVNSVYNKLFAILHPDIRVVKRSDNDRLCTQHSDCMGTANLFISKEKIKVNRFSIYIKGNNYKINVPKGIYGYGAVLLRVFSNFYRCICYCISIDTSCTKPPISQQLYMFLRLSSWVLFYMPIAHSHKIHTHTHMHTI